jgi:polyhydroxybutyrate depolymerase
MLAAMRWLGAFLLWMLVACSNEATKDGATSNASATASASSTGGGGGAGGAGGGVTVDCEPGTRDGPVEGAVGEVTPAGVDFNLRTPPGYDPTRAHPLVVVYSPAGVSDPVQTEQFTGLTPDAESRGYLAVYVNHRSPTSLAIIEDLGTAPGLVSARWCVDTARIYFTGHSDGGSVASVLALLGTTPPVAAIAPSAAGVDDAYLAAQTCPGALPAMVIHSQNDGLFPPPGFGEGAAEFWAGCSSCGAPGTALPDGCAPYDGCAAPSEVLYCETSGAHGQWYGLNASMFDFFERHARR